MMPSKLCIGATKLCTIWLLFFHLTSAVCQVQQGHGSELHSFCMMAWLGMSLDPQMSLARAVASDIDQSSTAHHALPSKRCPIMPRFVRYFADIAHGWQRRFVFAHL
jgi:hypothetical protein